MPTPASANDDGGTVLQVGCLRISTLAYRCVSSTQAIFMPLSAPEGLPGRATPDLRVRYSICSNYGVS